MVDSVSVGNPAIEVRGLVKRYGDVIAVDSLDLEVPAGRSVGLLGPNGAGKTTVLKAISGVISPSSGSISVNGIDVRRHREAMARVGCVIESPIPYPSFTPAEMLEFAGRLHGLCEDEIRIRSRDVLEELRIWECRGKKTGGFSKGMMQRVSLAVALIHEPDILLLDEPTSGLDPRGMSEFRRILADLCGKGLTMVISTHMLGEVSELCTDVAVMDRGRKVAGGRVDDLIRGMDAETVVSFRTAKSISEGLLKEISALPGVIGAELAGPCLLKVRFRGTEEQQAAIADLIQSHGQMLLSIGSSNGGLDSLYMSLTDGEEGLA